ncbi:unnamed protein product [Gordionus sp. m RMFG-2023]
MAKYSLILTFTIGTIVLILLAFFGSIGLTFIILACALQQFNNWYPLFVLLFHTLTFLLYILTQRNSDDLFTGSGTSNIFHEVCWFLLAGSIVSSFALPLVLAGSPILNPVIKWGACGLTLVGNILIFFTIFAYFKVFGNEDFNYLAW